MRFTIVASLVAALIGFVAVYATLSLDGKRGRVVVTDNSSYSSAKGNRISSFLLHKTPKNIEKIHFQDADGKVLSLSDWQGRYVLLNLWATWCGPCREEMPDLDRLKAKLGSDSFDVVTISMDKTGLKKPIDFFKEIKAAHLKLYIDQSAKTMFRLRSVGLPTTILIDKEGREIGRMAGPAKWDSDEAIAMLKKAMKKDGGES